jgi:hypothetical protein
MGTNSTKGKSYNSPPKSFQVPPNLAPLESYATTIVNAMRLEYAKRMAAANSGK